MTGAANTNTPGTVIFSWADAAPAAGSQALLRLTFQVSEVTDIPLTLDGARLLTSDGVSVTNVDIRNGKLLPSSLTYQAPAVDAATVVVANGQTAVETVLDIAAARTQAVRTRSVLPDHSLLLVFYEGDAMKAVSLQDFSVALDENGIAQIAVSASCAGTADAIRVFLLGEGGALVPAAEHICYDLEVSGS